MVFTNLIAQESNKTKNSTVTKTTINPKMVLFTRFTDGIKRYDVYDHNGVLYFFINQDSLLPYISFEMLSKYELAKEIGDATTKIKKNTFLEMLAKNKAVE